VLRGTIVLRDIIVLSRCLLTYLDFKLFLKLENVLRDLCYVVVLCYVILLY
jgi:predicted transcriptional regulator